MAVTGFGWSESQSYRWVRVLGVSLVANAAAVGVTTAGLLNCRGQDVGLGATQCGEMAALTAAGVRVVKSPADMGQALIEVIKVKN